MKKAVIFGFGGMGQRYYESLKKSKFDIIGICDKNLKKKKILKENIFFYKNYQKLLKVKSDLACITSNTSSRYKIILDLIKYSPIKRIITEKPLAISLEQAKKIESLCKKKKKKILVNTHRTYSKNFFNIKKFLTKKKENVTHIYINSPCAGIGNMGSTFFDIAQFFLNENPKSIFAKIDNTNTPNPRGKIFKDPGGYGVINYSQNKKVFFDLSENTGLPYKIILKTKNYEIVIDELNNKFYLEERPNKMRKKPLYFYLFKPNKHKMKIFHKFNVVDMTMFTIKEIFKKNLNYQNLKRAVLVNEIISACFVSSQKKQLINFPLKKKYHKIKCNFA